MASKKLLSGFVATLLLAALMLVSVSAAASVDNKLVTITDLEVSGVDVLGANTPVAEVNGDTIPVRVQFKADMIGSEVNDVRVTAWISGSRAKTVTTTRFDVLPGLTYAKTLAVPVPQDLNDDETEASYTLYVEVESRADGVLSDAEVDVAVLRESYELSVLDVDYNTEIKAGEVLALDVVLKNTGRNFADDAFVVAKIPALGIQDKAYFGDLSATDVSDPDKENTHERRLALRVPSTAPAGIYVVEVEAYNEDSITTITRKVVIKSSSSDTMAVSPVTSKVISAGSSEEYSMTLVNAGNTVQVYQLVVDSSSGLNVDVDESVVVIPAGSSKTVKFDVSADKQGSYNFVVNVHSGSEIVKTETYAVKVEGSTFGGNATVLLTVILAIIFVVLLVVLIVLLTRKSEKTEEFSESYY